MAFTFVKSPCFLGSVEVWEKYCRERQSRPDYAEHGKTVDDLLKEESEDRLEIRKSYLGGKGLFLAKDAVAIKENEFIGIYMGEINSNFSSCNNFRTWNIITASISVDASKLGNKVIFANHAPTFLPIGIKIQTANVKITVLFKRGKPYPCYQATRQIQPDEEIVVDYTRNFWQKSSQSPMLISKSGLLPNDGELMRFISLSFIEVWNGGKNFSKMRKELNYYKDLCFYIIAAFKQLERLIQDPGHKKLMVWIRHSIVHYSYMIIEGKFSYQKQKKSYSLFDLLKILGSLCDNPVGKIQFPFLYSSGQQSIAFKQTEHNIETIPKSSRNRH